MDCYDWTPLSLGPPTDSRRLGASPRGGPGDHVVQEGHVAIGGPGINSRIFRIWIRSMGISGS